MTASVSPLPSRPPAIASPATPPPRHTTSNSCVIGPPPQGAIVHALPRDHAAIRDNHPDLLRPSERPDVLQRIIVQDGEVCPLARLDRPHIIQAKRVS